METKDPNLCLIENSLIVLTNTYKTEFKYEVSKVNISYIFEIYQNKHKIYSREFFFEDDLSKIYSLIIRDFIVGGIERIYMQKENEKRLFPKSHRKINEGQIKKIKSNW